jgi:hypothetical protein
MNNFAPRASLVALMALAVSSLQGSGGSIGFAAADGSFQADSAKVTGSATLFDGTEIATGAAPSQIRLNNGASIRLAAGSRARLYESRAVLEEGNAQFETSTGYMLEANNLRISGAATRVQLEKSNRVMVAALRGPIQVMNANGMLLGQVESGRAQAFEGGAAGPMKITGCVSHRDGVMVITETSTGIGTEVRGAGIEKEIGNQVEVTGAAGAGYLNASAVTHIGKGCAVKTSSKAKAGAAGAAGAAVGAGTAGAIGVGGAVAGVSATAIAIGASAAGAAAIAGSAAAGVFSGSGSSTPGSGTSR